MQKIWGKCCYKAWKKQRRKKTLSLGLWNYWIVKTTGSWFKELIKFTWHFTSLINSWSTSTCLGPQISLPKSHKRARFLCYFHAWKWFWFSPWALVPCPHSGTQALRRMTVAPRRSQLCHSHSLPRGRRILCFVKRLSSTGTDYRMIDTQRWLRWICNEQEQYS